MTQQKVKFLDLIQILGTIGGAATVIFFLNSYLNKLVIKNRFFESFFRDINDQQLFGNNRFDTKEAIKQETRKFFSFEGIYKRLTMVDDQQRKITELEK